MAATAAGQIRTSVRIQILIHLIGLAASLGALTAAGTVYFAQVDINDSIGNFVGGSAIVATSIWVAYTVRKELLGRNARLERELLDVEDEARRWEAEAEKWRARYDAEFDRRIRLLEDRNPDDTAGG